MLKLNDTYSIIKGWPKLIQCVNENQPSVPAYIVEKERLLPSKLSYEEFKERKAKRLEIEEQMRINDKLAEEGKDTELKKFFSLEYMIYSDTKDLPYPSAYNADMVKEIYDAETEVVDVEIDDYLKGVLDEYLNSADELLTPANKVVEGPIWIIKRT